MPEKIRGVDISVYQAGIDFQRLAEAGVKFAIIRAGCGSTRDSQIDAFVEGCRSVGIKYGFYWYTYARTAKQAEAEADECIKAIKGYSPEYPVYFDIEDNYLIDGLTKRLRTDMVHAFCARLREAGYTAGVYANPAWFENYLEKSELAGRYEIWLAHWTDSPELPSRYDYGQKVWQWGLDKVGNYDVDGDISFYDYGGSEEISGGCSVVVSGIESVSAAEKLCGEMRERGYSAEISADKSNKTDGSGETAEEAGEDKTELAVGDKVMVRDGARDYNGGALASFVYKTVYTVMQTGAGVADDYVVIGVDGAVTAAVRAVDLIKCG